VNDKPKKPKLTTKEKLFVKEEVHNVKASSADRVRNAGYNPANERNATAMATVMRAKPKIQESIRQEIEKMYPDRLGKNVEALARIADNIEGKPMEVVAAVKELNNMAGYKAATQHQRLTANISVPKLPKE